MASAVLLAVFTAQVAFLCHSLHVSAELPPEKALILDLKEKYKTPLGRPVQSTNETVVVNVNLGLFRLMEVHPEEKKLVIVASLIQWWKDSVLQWDPSAHGGVERVSFTTDDIWTPDFEHINAIEPAISMTTRPYRPLVSSDGLVRWNPVFKLTAPCGHFHEGSITCSVDIGSYSTWNKLVNITSDAKLVDMANYEANEEWEIHTSKVETRTVFYDSAPDIKFGHLGFELKLRDRNWHARKTNVVDSKASGRVSSSLIVFVLAVILAYGL